MPPLFKTPKEKMASALTALALFAIFKHFSAELLARFVFLFFFMFLFEFIFWKIRGVKSFRPTAGAVTTLIIFLLADPRAPLTLAVFALFAAVGFKQLLRPAGAHIFNPAASGLLAASFFGLPISWWGIGSDYFSLAATILLTGYVSLYTIRQWRIVTPFLITLILLSSPSQLLVGSFWFFTLVMLPEPMTAAHYPTTRIFYGILVALLSLALPRLGVYTEPLLTALLLGNLSAWTLERKVKT